MIKKPDQQPLPIRTESAAEHQARQFAEWMARKLPQSAYPTSTERAINGTSAMEMLRESLEDADTARMKLYAIGDRAHREGLHHHGAACEQARRVLDRALEEIAFAMRVFGEDPEL